MANYWFESGRNAFAAGTVNWANGKGGAGAIQAALITLTSTTGIKPITGATTGAGLAAVTCTGHGFANGDLVVITGVGGTTTANNVWAVSGQTTNAFNLVDPLTGVQGTLVGTYTSGGFAINLGPSAAGATWASFSAANSGYGAPGIINVGSPSEVQGMMSGSGVTFPLVPGPNVATGIIILATASPTPGTLAGTDIPLVWIDGQQIVQAACNTAALSATTAIPCQPLAGPLASGVVLPFSDGTTATTNGAALQGARSVPVTATGTQTAGARASAPATGSGLPVTPNGGNIGVTWDSVGISSSVMHVGIARL